MNDVDPQAHDLGAFDPATELRAGVEDARRKAVVTDAQFRAAAAPSCSTRMLPLLWT